MAYTIAALRGEPASSVLTERVAEILASSLRATGVLGNGNRPVSGRERWLEGAILRLQGLGFLDTDLRFRRDVRPLEELFGTWDDLCPSQPLLKACLGALPEVLAGGRLPEELVAALHLEGAVYNEALAAALGDVIERELEGDPERNVCIIEIGAGTGTTTAALLPVLERYAVEEYCFTDRSEEWLPHAETEFRPQYPALRTALLDVSRPLGSQAVATDRYDVAIAANVFWTTANVREALRNTKAVLKNGGVLLLDEMSTWSLFDHVSLGLLEEYWQYEDAAVRQCGSPIVAQERWREILAMEGFECTVFPAAEADRAGRHVLAAVSDGWARQQVVNVTEATQDRREAPQPVATARVPAEAAEQRTSGYARQVVAAKLADALRMNPNAIRHDAPFAGYGVDSIIGVNLVRNISEALAIDLEPTSLFEYSTVEDLARYIGRRWHDQLTKQVSWPPAETGDRGAAPGAEPAEAEHLIGMTRFGGGRSGAEVRPTPSGPGPIAVIGMSGRFAECDSLDAFWQSVVAGKCMVKEVTRWRPEDCVMADARDGGFCSAGSFIDAIDQFDPAFFGISELEATYMDPQQRLFLEEAWRALEDAGYATTQAGEKQCGVYVGCGSSKYDRLHPREIPPAHVFWGNSSAITPARIAYSLNLQGPAIAVDTACSSSLVAIHLACQGLWSEETEMAVAGGVFLNATAGFFQVANRARMLSPDGKCYSFDARANGFVPGEGVGVLVLKRLKDAVAAGDAIHGVIAASGINQDGRSNGLTAPNGRAQERLERAVYDRFRIDPGTIQVVEAHGTGSLLGDSVEHAALTRAFREYTDRKQFCALGTVKTNIGHASAASGVAGALKVLLSMKHGVVPPSLHFERANPTIDFESSPFYVNTAPKEWSVGVGEVRRAAISSFGFGGTNAHLVLDGPPTGSRTDDTAPAYLIVASARSGERLRCHARNLLDHIKATPNLSLTDLSFSLMMGRTHFDHRLACLAGSLTELERVLSEWLDAGDGTNVFVGEAREGRAREKVSLRRFGNHCIESCSGARDAVEYRENLATVAELYVQGYGLEFGALYPGGARRIPLPTYPFDRKSYWIDGEPEPDERPAEEEMEIVPAPAAERRVEEEGGLESDLALIASGVLSVEPSRIAPHRVLQDLGFDSVGLTKLATAISERYQVDVTPVAFFDYPTIHEIAGYLLGKFGGALRRVSSGARDVAPPAGPGPKPARARSSAVKRPAADGGVREPVVIVGMAGVMPQSDDLDELWSHLESSRNLITPIPRDRWNWEEGFGDPRKDVNKYNTKWGGFMRAVDRFDPRFFSISPREAVMMDPQQRIFLETAWKAVEDAGQKASELSGTRCGVFAAAGNNDYKEILRNVEGGLDGYSASGNTNSVLANRISFLLNLRGPSECIDTACSSALIALHRAVLAIQADECEVAIVGGVNALVSPEPYIAFSKAGLLSPDGQCKTFDKRANGFVRAEGAGAVFVKRLSAAERDGNHIYAVVRSTAANHGGRVPTLGAPSSSGQVALLLDAYGKGGVDPATVGYIECHGTGTALGDPVETEALTTAFAELYRRRGRAVPGTAHCGLASIKTNIGHLENAAGIAGLLKALLAIRHRALPASLNFETLNPYVKLANSPFYIVDKLTPWVAPTGTNGAPGPRCAGVSSFGFGGANAHVVLEEYVPKSRAEAVRPRGPQLIVLSAKNEERLKEYAGSMAAYLRRTSVELEDLAFTLQTGRDEMPERVAFVANSTEEAGRTLERFAAGERDGVFHANARRAGPAGESPIRCEADPAKCAELWTSGGKMDWGALHPHGSPKRISLPTYPFARERHWAVTAVEAGKDLPGGRDAVAALHPMVHRNVSTLDQQKFSSRFSGREFFLGDHRVAGQSVLPAVGYLEMVRAAGELAGLPRVSVIRNVTWQRPLVVGEGGEEVEVTLAPENDDVKVAVRTTANGRSTVHCTGKLVRVASQGAPEVLDVAAIRARCTRQTLSGPDLYGPVLAGSGLELRRSFQVVQSIHASDSEALGALEIPEHLKREADRFYLHPAMMDGAIQTFVGLVKKVDDEPLPLTLPFSMGEVRVFASLERLRFAYVKVTDSRKLDVEMLDARGAVLVSVRDFVLRPAQDASRPAAPGPRAARPTGAPREEEAAASVHVLAPVWNPVRPNAGTAAGPPGSGELALVGNAEQLEWLRASVPTARMLPPDEADAKGAGEQLVWIAPDVTDGPDSRWDLRVIERQEEGVLALFGMVKALLKAGHGTKALKWTIVTRNTQRVRAGDAIQPVHAGIAGLIGSLAKEYPRWDLRLLDVDSLSSVTARECLSLPFEKLGNPYAHRAGEWFTQSLARVEALPVARPLYRENGVYVVIGGAGGVGEVWSRFMIERHHAKIVWIGRRPVDATIEAKLGALARLGPAPQYVAADGTDAAALERARDLVVQRCGPISGVVHSAIVLQDQSIARMSEQAFRTTLAAKVDVSVNMDRVFGEQPLDFMLFFSSLISFVKTPGQSNYSAGCTFKDAFAHRLQKERPFPVKVMNWGYWGSVGVVADEEYNKRMARLGTASIEPDEAMTSLQAFVDSELRQVAVVKLREGAATPLVLAETISCEPEAGPGILPALRVEPRSTAPLEAEAPSPDLMELVGGIMAASIAAGGWRVSAAPYLERWLKSSLDYLDERGADRATRPLEELWAAWSAARPSWLVSENRGAYVELIETCLRALPDILSGRRRPTDVMFPSSSMRLVEPIYKGNAQADYFNGALGQTLSGCLDEWVRRERDRPIRIIEIGAGTGGTTAGLLPMLRQYPIAEYCYTDLSKAFLMHAEKAYRAQLPALVTAIFDVSRPPASQGIRTGHYDIAIAANVLHATRNIRETLRNAKALLRRQGVLLLNELSTWNLLAHVTFGLLEGWWLYEDDALRLPGTPGVPTETWRAVLEEEGFDSVLFAAPDAHRFGQQIIAASSNGWVRQRVVREAAAASQSAGDAGRAETVVTGSGPADGGEVRRIIRDALAEALKLEVTTIRDDEPFADYGVDSIIGVNLVSTISEKLQIELETATLFEYTTVEQLSEHIASTHRNAVAAQGRPEKGRPAEPPSPPARRPGPPDPAGAGDVRDVVREALAEALKLDRATIRDDEAFAEYGVDSIIGVNLVATISEKLRIELETSALFEFSTVEQLADHIRSQFGQRLGEGRGAEVAPRAPEPAEEEVPRTHRFAHRPPIVEVERQSDEEGSEGGEVGPERIAIIGMSGRFAESESLEEFWRNLVDGRDLVKTVARWKASDCVVPGHGGSYCTDGSFVESIDRFDPAFFRIGSEEAVCMDPQQRLFLEESWKALEDAGYAGRAVREKECGVYVGCLSSRYLEMLGPDRPAYALWGTAESVIPTRIAYYLDLRGPAIAIDTACSSSLVAIHLACQALWTRETEMALAGGVFLQPTVGFYRMANGAGMLSPDGRCFSFDARANGYVPGEGVGVVVMKRLRDALRDGDHVYGVIAGTAINQDGSSNGLIAPNARAQERLERAVYDRFQINPETIQFVEAHGSGTLLGDSIEVGALTRAFRRYTERTQFCAIGTLKTNLGHTVTAAGVAGVMKVLLGMKHRLIPPTLHLRNPNPGIALESGPFYVNTDVRDWTVEDGAPRRAAVSSFGFNGTNAHMVLEEAPVRPRIRVEAPGYLLVLSARTREQLRRQVGNLVERLQQEPGLEMNDVAFTLVVGRMHLKHRIACVAHDQEDAVRLFSQWLAAGEGARVWSAEVQDGRMREHASLAKLGNRAIQECRSAAGPEYLEQLGAIADLHVQGYALELETLFAAGSRRVPLPTYPFADERFWVDGKDASPRTPAVEVSSRLRPSLQRESSIPGRRSYRSRLASPESFEGACLEMVRAALVDGALVPEGSAIELQDVVWGDALTGSDVTIAVTPGEDRVSYEIAGDGGPLCRGQVAFVARASAAPLSDAQPLARLTAGEGEGDGATPPEFLNAVLRAAGAGGTVRSIGRLLLLSPCRGTMSLQARRTERGIDLDVVDADGNPSVLMRGVTFRRNEALQPRWSFSREPSGSAVAMGAPEKAALYVRQEVAIQLGTPVTAVPTDLSFFDLGMSSLGMANLVQNICALIAADFAPSLVFEHRDIDSLASYLASTYAPALDEIVVAPADGQPLAGSPETRAEIRTPNAQVAGPGIATGKSSEEFLDAVWRKEGSVEDGYEKVTI